MYQEKLKINPKRGRERPIFKKSVSILYFIFPQKWQMQQHLAVDHGSSEGELKCQECSKTFKWARNLLAHMATSHQVRITLNTKLIPVN